MRILLDESIPLELEEHLAGYDVSTVRAQRSAGLRNGVLLRAAADAGFDVLITTDSSMRYQQNLKRIGIAIIVTVGVRNRFDELRSLMPRIIELLAIIRPGDAVEIKAHRTDSVCDRRLSLVL